MINLVFSHMLLIEVETTRINGLLYQRYKTPYYNASDYTPKSTLTNPSILSAQVLWIDTNHQYAIAQSGGIYDNGSEIVIGWTLNNHRVSRYFTNGNGIPDWVYYKTSSIWWSDLYAWTSRWNYKLAVSRYGSSYDFMSSSSPNPIYSFNNPSVVYAYASPDGNYSVLITNDYKVIYLNNQNQTILWTYNANQNDGGFYGVSFSLDNLKIAISQYYKITILNATNGSIISTISNYGQTSAKLSANGNYLLQYDFLGNVRVYQYNGNTYTLLSSYNVGSNRWITNGDISDDGKYIIVGTYIYSPSDAGSVHFFRLSNNQLNLLWSNNNYGDFVSSVSISADGSRMIVCSWGKYNGTFGDIITIYDSLGNVIINVPDDASNLNDKGSCFLARISKDGRFAIASGKATHARDWGNGGYVYAFKIIDPYSTDLAISQIISPPTDLQSNQTYSNSIKVKNVGLNSANNVKVYTKIYFNSIPVDSDSVSLSSINPNSEIQVNFKNFTPTQYGVYSFEYKIYYPSDEDTTNNKAIRTSINYHDVSAQKIIYPYLEFSEHKLFKFYGIVKNNGSYDDNVKVKFLLLDQFNNTIYQDSVNTFIQKHQEMIVNTQNEILLPPGNYKIKLIANTIDEYYLNNDTMQRDLNSIMELLSDDGEVNIFYYVSSDFYNNKFFQGFKFPTYKDSFLIKKIRIYLYSNQTTQFQISLNKDSSNLPSLSDFVIPPQTFTIGNYQGWFEWDNVNVKVASGTKVWLALNYLPNYPSTPYIGFDSDFDETPFSDSTSYWYWEGNPNYGFNPMFYGNLMMRITYDTLTVDISEGRVVKNYIKLYKNYIEISTINPTYLNIKAYTVDGRKIFEIKENVNRGIYKLPLKFNSNGVFILSVETDFNKRVFKFVNIK
ncbi:MAG: WD40 repeat domain-containing protein [candidate division WOR-3 bacterium]